ncbi:MAG: flagellar biosynthesis protein FlhB [Planctomycetes bacterium]|nr:flagellar biosynthesis protein FlhB [Planctomycetota bacterium]
MAERESRTEPPTGKRRSEARGRGQVAKSQDLNVALLLLAVFSVLYFAGQPSIDKMRAIMIRCLSSLTEFQFDLGYLVRALGWSLAAIFQVVLPFFILAFAMGVLSNLLQVGFLYTAESIKPSLSKVNPLNNLGKIFSLRGATRTVFGVFKIVVVGSVLVWTLWKELTRQDGENIFMLFTANPGPSVAYAFKVILLMGFRGVTALLILSILDYAYQKWQYERDLMMTKQEVKDEMMEMEGNPKVRERRRRVQQQLALQRMMRNVPKSDVVITNPTHFAVAIQYRKEAMLAPVCLAKGQDTIAQRIREIAMEHGVPVVERPELARALYRAVEVGQEIPPEFYHAVAEVLAYVYRLARRPSLAGQTA